MRMQNVAAGVIALTAIAGVHPAALAQQEDKKAVEVIAAARKAIGGKKLDSLKSLSVQAALQRNAGNFQMNSDLELFVELPDKYMRSEASSNAMVSMGNTLGFNGDRPLKSVAQGGIAPGGGMVIRMGGPAGGSFGSGEKPTPEQKQQIDRQMVRASRSEISRLMLGWFGMTHPSVSAPITSGRDDNGDTVFNDRPAGISRNSAVSKGMWDVGARVSYGFGFGQRPATGPMPGGQTMVIRGVGGASDLLGMLGGGGAEDKRVRFELYVSAQNLLNHVNPIGFSGVMTSPFFGQPTAAMPGRRIDVGMRIGF